MRSERNLSALNCAEKGGKSKAAPPKSGPVSGDCRAVRMLRDHREKSRSLPGRVIIIVKRIQQIFRVINILPEDSDDPADLIKGMGVAAARGLDARLLLLKPSPA